MTRFWVPAAARSLHAALCDAGTHHDVHHELLDSEPIPEPAGAPDMTGARGQARILPSLSFLSPSTSSLIYVLLTARSMEDQCKSWCLPVLGSWFLVTRSFSIIQDGYGHVHGASTVDVEPRGLVEHDGHDGHEHEHEHEHDEEKVPPISCLARCVHVLLGCVLRL